MRVEFWDAADRLMDDLKFSENFLEKGCTDTLEEPSAMKIYVKVASNEKPMMLEAKSSHTVRFVKSMIHSKEGISPKQQFLFFDGVLLDDDETLATYLVEEWSIIYAVFCPVGFDPTVDAVKKTIMIPRWQTVEIDVKSWYTVREIKAVVESLTGFQLDPFVLTHGGKLLEDSMTMADWDINKESPIYMLQPPSIMENYSSYCKNFPREGDEFKIFIRDCDWDESFLVSKSNTVFDIKKMIENFAALPPNQQVLFHGKNMAKLEDGKTLGFYNVKETSTLWLFSSSLKLSIKMPQAGTTNLVKVHSFDFVCEIKEIVSEEMGIPFSTLTLIHSGKSLDEDETLEACNIKRNSVVYAIIGLDDEESEELALTIVIPMGDSIEIKVKTWYSISDVKAVIESMTQIPICVLDLYHSNHGKLKNWKTVWDYAMKNNFTIKMAICSSPVQLFIHTKNGKNDTTAVIEAKNSDTVDTIMDMIPQEAIEIIDGQPCLFLDHTRLLGNKMLAQYGIQSGSFLSLDQLIQINVIIPNGKTIQVDLKASYKIDTVKEKIEKICGIPHEVQRLTYRDDELDDFLTVGQYEDLLGSLWVLRWNFGGKSWSFFWPSYEGCVDGCENKKWKKKVKFVL